MSLDITFYAIEWGVTTCPGYGKSCHRWPLLIKWSLTTIVLRLKEIRYCSIVASDSLKTLAYHSLSKYWMQKIKNLETKYVTTSPSLPYYFFCLSSFLVIYFKYTHSRKWPNFCPTVLTRGPYTDPRKSQSLTYMSSYTNPLCLISDITAVFSSASIAIGIFELNKIRANSS